MVKINDQRAGNFSKRALDGDLQVLKVKKCLCGSAKIFQKRGRPECTRCSKTRTDLKKVNGKWQ